MFPRVLIASAALAPALAVALWPSFVTPVVIGSILFFRGLRDEGTADRIKSEPNPLQFKSALQMTAVFQFVLFGVNYAQSHFGEQGVLGSALLTGAFDMDALTISMAQMTRSGTSAAIAARAIAVGGALQHDRQAGHRPCPRPGTLSSAGRRWADADGRGAGGGGVLAVERETQNLELKFSLP